MFYAISAISVVYLRAPQYSVPSFRLRGRGRCIAYQCKAPDPLEVQRKAFHHARVHCTRFYISVCTYA